MTKGRSKPEAHSSPKFIAADTTRPDELHLDTDDGPVFYVTDIDGLIVYGNKNYGTLTQLVSRQYQDNPEAAPFPLSQQHLVQITDEMSRQHMSVVREEAIIVGELVKRYRSIHVDLYDAQGELSGLAALYLDTTREHEAASNAAKMHERLHDITRLVSDWVWETDSKYKLAYVSPRITDTLGLIPQNLVGLTLEEIGTFVADSEVHGLTNGRFREAPFEVTDSQGQCRLFQVSGIPFYCANTGAFLGVRGTATDVTDKHRAEERIHRLAHYDPLTNLPNRTLFQEQLSISLNRARAKGGILALLYLDLDDFKEINDSHGHDFGDKLLKAVAERLRNHIRTNDKFGLRESEVIARLGGDEFTLILQDLKDAEGAATAAQRVIAEIAKPFHIDGHEISTTASTGIAVYREGEIESDKLLKNADLALYQSKANGRGKYFFYSPDLNDDMQARKALERDLGNAIDRDEMHLCFHPLVDISTGQVTGVETLLRWIHPKHGEVPPDVFIPVAETTGVITRLGEWVMRESCRQVKKWHDAGLRQIRVGINLSPVQFRRSDLPQLVKRILVETSLDPRWLEIEITEGMLMDNVETVTDTLQALRDLGVDLAIDDFGTGYSSLAYLQRFPVNRLKIDRSFVDDVCSNSGNAAITKAIVTLAHDLGMKVIAEGVESQVQFDFLKSLRCDEAQGFHFTQPLTTAEMTKWLRDTCGAVS